MDASSHDADAATALDAAPATDANPAPPPLDDDAGAAPDDAAAPPLDAGSARIGVFVAQGYAGRSVRSCDDGRSWIDDQSMDDALRCFEGTDCDHHPGRAMGIVHAGGRFVATFGWGAGGSVRVSDDGRTWRTTLADRTFGGVAALDGRVLLGQRAPMRSDDRGETWTEAGTPTFAPWNVRATGAVPLAGGLFLMVAEDARDSDLAFGDGAGRWSNPSTFPAECGQGVMDAGGIGHAGAAMVVVGADGIACSSTDGGTTWRSSALGTATGSQLVEADGALWVWGGGRRYRTVDGVSWSSEPTSPPDVVIGAVARAPGGTLVAVNAGWRGWYAQQRFYRSTDGLRWEALAPGQFTGGHPIHGIAFGEVDASACR